MPLLKGIFKHVWPEVKKYRLVLFLIITLFSTRIILDNIVRTYYFKKIIDFLSDTSINRTLFSSEIFKLVFVLIGISATTFIISRSVKFIYFKFEINVIKGLRNYTFQKIEEQSQNFFSNTFAGGLVTKSRRFVGAFESMFDIFIYNFLSTFIILFGIFFVLINESKTIGLIFIVWAVIHITVVSFIVKRKMKYDILEAEQDSKISGRLADVFSNILAVKFFSSKKRELDSFKEYTEEGAKRSTKAWFLGGKIDLVQHSLIFGVQSVILYTMISLWTKNQISTGTVVLIQTYMVIIFNQLWDFGNSLTRFMKSASDMKEMIDIFETIPDILDPEKPEVLKIKNGEILFKDVDFEYHDGQKLLNNFNFQIKSGESIGVVGHSGAGKSTITKLLLRFNEISSGSISIDGQNIKNITQDDLRSVIAYVPQEPILFHRTIMENIAYSRPSATFEEIVEVAKKAHAHEFIIKLSKGYETKVGERGIKLSGGERQRIAIARAMLKNTPIIMLDEATSSLDSVSEFYIQDAFKKLTKGKTTIVIAHRLSTIQEMDRIIVLDDGEIAEQGRHEELIKNEGIYADLWQHQTGGFLK
jgi:ATP-binding cassette subfamily B protein